MLIKSILILDAEWHFKNGKGSNDKKKTKKKNNLELFRDQASKRERGRGSSS